LTELRSRVFGVMPGLGPGIPIYGMTRAQKYRDCRDKPGDDD
jgi:hypothetical protein